MHMTSEQDWKRYALEERRNRTAAQAALLGIVKAWDSLKPGQYDKDIWETWLAQKMKPAVDSARAGITCPAEQLPEDFVRLIIAARIVAFSDQSREALKELDTASEAFAECVPWEDQPERH
jgi:hypothetical protein